MNVEIRQLSIGELMDGRYLFVPDYQRGYRWTEQQVQDLLHDLITFIDEKNERDFYSLQPIIVRKMPKEEYGRALDSMEAQNALEKGVWEIVDGQQRLTTLLILYRFLMHELNKTDEKLQQDGKELYKILYQTRRDTESFLRLIGTNSNTDEVTQSNVDFFCMDRAYRTIKSYIYGEGLKLSKKAEGSVDNENWELFRLLNGKVGAEQGSVQVMWYQLPEDGGPNVVREFQKINSGKIRLTDAELIKALLLRKRNFDEYSATTQQDQCALEWEQIENRLCDEAFWGFLHRCRGESPQPANRIDFIFELIYRYENRGNIDEAALVDPRKSVVFRYFSSKLDKESSRNVWKDVRNIFWLLEDWFNDPIIYNLIGLLTSFGVDVVSHVIALKNIEAGRGTHDEFIGYLQKCVSQHISANANLMYGDRKVKDTLLAMNIAWLNRLCKQRNTGDRSMYKFPFAAFSSTNWDIEHIASYHDTKLDGKEGKDWVQQAMDDLDGLLTDEEKTRLQNQDDVSKQIEWLQERMKEREYTEDEKNDIGNLTLLDSSTNRSYGNALFCTKRRYIMQRIKDGQFVPPLTQYVFFKLFDEKGTNRSYWTREDMEKYKKVALMLLESFNN